MKDEQKVKGGRREMKEEKGKEKGGRGEGKKLRKTSNRFEGVHFFSLLCAVFMVQCGDMSDRRCGLGGGVGNFS